MVYRITVQKVGADGVPGELVEIIETERDEWTNLFKVVDEIRAEINRETVFLYNGILMDEDGEQFARQPRAFQTLLEATSWVSAMEYDVDVVMGDRRGDKIVAKEE